MFIGPPGAGKTTALVNSGLKFPLEDSGKGATGIRGVGGTRNCDWWFTDEAVLIDTAGRYTTQDSQAAVDSAAWLGFLSLLKTYRRRQPINGVLIAISLSDLAVLAEAERLGHARTIKQRIRELHDQFAVRFPIYVLFTKADLIAGFVEFFANLGKEEREQVWGMTFPVDDGKEEGGAVAAFPDRVRPAARPPERPRAGARAAGPRHRQPQPDLRLPAAGRLLAGRRGRRSWTRSSAPAGWRPAPCCAARTSPAARRTARRSTGCWARCPGSSACSARRPPRSAAAGAATSCSA